MKVLVLGATGGVGRHIVEQGLARGHQITALVRSPEKMQAHQGRVHLLQGNALEADAVTRAVAGQEAVAYAIGSERPGKTTLFSDSTRVLLAAMQQQNVRRLVVITGVGAGETKGHGGFLYDRLLYPLFTRRLYEDKERQEELIRNSSLEWVIVRPAVFREGSAPAPFQAVTEIGGVTLRRISRAEVASFVLDQLTSNTFLRKAVFIGHSR